MLRSFLADGKHAACTCKDTAEGRTKTKETTGKQEIKLEKDDGADRVRCLQEVMEENYNCKANAKGMNQLFTHSDVTDKKNAP